MMNDDLSFWRGLLIGGAVSLVLWLLIGYCMHLIIR
jgi:hypothetical protein